MVEDDDSIRETLALALEMAGHDVQAVTGVDGALASIERNWPDVLLLDLTLGGSTTGDSFYCDLIARFGVAPPTIFLSGVSDGERRVSGRAWSGVRFLPKPSSIEALEQAVNAALEWGRNHPERSRLGPRVA